MFFWQFYQIPYPLDMVQMEIVFNVLFTVENQLSARHDGHVKVKTRTIYQTVLHVGCITSGKITIPNSK